VLNPQAPFKAVAEELGVHRAQAVDCQRACSIPPNVSAEDLAKFLELPAG
jgi:hypothetical protein